jgi:microcystin-dependent protein
MYLKLYIILIFYAISQNFIYTQDFFQVQLSPLTLTSVPYLDGEVSVYEHKQNRSRLFVPPLAVLYLNQTRVFYRLLDKQYLLRLSLVLYTNELRTTILQYLSNTRNRCSPPQEICDIKTVPTERFRLVWKRKKELSSNYKLDTSWQSNTALLNNINVYIECSTNQTCYELLNNVLETPDILNGLELEYSTQTEKQSRKVVTITGQHVIKTQMYSKLKQLPSTTAENHVRYLLVDDMNQLVTEILTRMELEEITDLDYIAQNDENILTELLRQRLSLNIETLHGHTEQQWNSVYWNSDNIRPDRIVHLLNDELKQLQNKTSLTHQNQSFTHEQRNQQRISQNHSHDGFDKSDHESVSNRSKIDRVDDRAGSNSTGQKIVDQISSDRSKSHSFGDSHSNSNYIDRSSSYGGSVGGSFMKFGASGSYSQSNAKIDGSSNSKSNYGSNEWRNAFGKNTDRSYDNSHAWKNTTATGDDLSLYNEKAWRDAASQDRQTAIDQSRSGQDTLSFEELRQKNFDFYTNNRQFIEFTGEKFIVKPVTAYKLNLATFQENTQFVTKRIVVAQVDMIHAVPLRILSSPSSEAVFTKIPVTDKYTNVFESKLNELNEKLNMSLAMIENNVEKLQLNTENQLTKLNYSIEIIENNVEKSQLNTENQLTKLNYSIEIIENNVEKSQLNTENQLKELKSSKTIIKNDVEKLKLHTENQLKELKSSKTIIKNDVEKLKLHTSRSSPLVGEIKLYSGAASSLPCNWVLCHGQALSRTEYQRLFSAIGESFGAGNGYTTFNAPDFRYRFPLGLDPTESWGDGWEKGGKKEQTLTIDQMPTHHHSAGTLSTTNAGSHIHRVNDPGHNHGGNTEAHSFARYYHGWVSNDDRGFSHALGGGNNDVHSHKIPHGYTGISLNNDGTHSHSIQGSTGSAGSGNSFSIMPPYQTIAYIIFTGASCA